MDGLLQVRASLYSPTGAEIDLTPRILGLDTLQESIEDDLASLEHSDLPLTVTDEDGAVAAFLAGAEPGDSYELLVMRETGRRRMKWERAFAGVLDLPGSVHIDRKKRLLSLQVFAYTKLLTFSSAEDIKRTYDGHVANTTDGLALTEFDDTTGLLEGDKITIADSDNSESRRIKTVNNGTQATMEEPWGTTFAGASVTLDTPYYRNKTIEWLADQLIDGTGIVERIYELGQILAEYPVATELNTDGLPSGVSPVSIVDEFGNIGITYPVPTTFRRVAESPQSGFDTGVASNITQGDWRPYLLEEPGSIHASGTLPDEGASNIVIGYGGGAGSGPCWDHAGGRVWSLQVDTGQPPPPDPDGERTILRLIGPDFDVAGDIIDFYTDPSGDAYAMAALEYAQLQDQVWVSYRRADASNDTTVVVDLAADTITPIAGLTGGQLRSIRQLGIDQRGLMAWYAGTTLKLLSMDDYTVQKTATVPAGLKLWSMRYLDGQLVVLYVLNNTTRLLILDAETLDQVADYEVAQSSDGPHLLTVFTEADSQNVGVGFAGGRYFVLARYFAGVIPYADFKGLSRGAALRELALAAAAVLEVDEFKVLRLVGRSFLFEADPQLELDTPLEQESLPVWENYRASVEVKGKTEDGEEISVIKGDTGDSAHRLEISCRFATTAGLCDAIASLYAAHFGAMPPRSQENVSVDEPGVRMRPLRSVRLAGKRYLVEQAESDLRTREQDLVLVEI